MPAKAGLTKPPRRSVWPEAARALLMYRFRTLPGARANAAHFGFSVLRQCGAAWPPVLENCCHDGSNRQTVAINLGNSEILGEREVVMHFATAIMALVGAAGLTLSAAA